jgi:hypothetical protein
MEGDQGNESSLTSQRSEIPAGGTLAASLDGSFVSNLVV